MNTIPNLFVLGAPRSGTSFLFSVLANHPDVFAPPVKEPHFFLADRWPHGGPENKAFTKPLQDYLAGRRATVWGGVVSDRETYAGLFAAGAMHRWRIDGTPNYLHGGAEVAERIVGATPEMRAIVILRDPVDRALSHYQLFRQNGWETKTFSDAISEAPKRLEMGWVPAWDYLRFSEYDAPLRMWQALLGDRLKVVSFNDLIWNPSEHIADIHRWLGLTPQPLAAGTELNTSAEAQGETRTSAEAAIRAIGRLDLDRERAVVAQACNPHIPPPLVSIGMPARNGAATIERALGSLLAQTYPNLRITVCDNASTDGTADVVRAIAQADPRVRLLRFESSHDIHESYARALETAEGEYFLFAPCDDSWTPGFLAAAVGRMQANPAIAVCCGRIELFDDAGSSKVSGGIWPVRGSPTRRWQRALMRSKDASRLYGLIRREALKDLFPRSAPFGWDHYVAAKLALRGEIAVLKTTAMHRHQTPMEDYRAYLERHEAGFWQRVFYARHITRLFEDDPEFDTSTFGARAAMWSFVLRRTDLALRGHPMRWLGVGFKLASQVCGVAARLAVRR